VAFFLAPCPSGRGSPARRGSIWSVQLLPAPFLLPIAPSLSHSCLRCRRPAVEAVMRLSPARHGRAARPAPSPGSQAQPCLSTAAPRRAPRAIPRT
jgi:hypothetical protein